MVPRIDKVIQSESRTEVSRGWREGGRTRKLILDEFLFRK